MAEKHTALRQSNFEILRILAILLIITFHYVFKGGYKLSVLSINEVTIKTFWMFGEWGVDLFMLITGYFMVNKTFRKKRFTSILMQVQFYTVLTAIVGHALGFFHLRGIKAWLLFFFPVITGRYWFVTAYVLVYLLIPFINIFLNALDRRQWERFLGITLLVWCVIPTVFGTFQNTTEGMLYYTRFLWYIGMYCLGAYCRRFPIWQLANRRRCFYAGAVAFAVLELSIILITLFPVFFGKIGIKEPAYFWPPNTIPMAVLSVATFCWFAQLKVKANWLINRFASTTLAVYMLHDGILSSWLWHTVFNNATHQDSPFLLLHILSAGLSIFLVGSLIDFGRQKLETLFWNKWETRRNERI